MWKMNGFSIIYALLMTLFVEIIVREYYLLEHVSFINETFLLAVCIILLVALWYPLMKRTSVSLGARPVKYVSSILWFPYALLFVYLYGWMFPITNPQYQPTGGTTFMLIPVCFLMLLYSLSINFFSSLHDWVNS